MDTEDPPNARPNENKTTRTISNELTERMEGKTEGRVLVVTTLLGSCCNPLLPGCLPHFHQIFHVHTEHTVQFDQDCSTKIPVNRRCTIA